MLEKIMQFVGEILNGIDPDRVKNGAMKAADMANQAVQAAGGTEAINSFWNNYGWRACWECYKINNYFKLKCAR